ncbi:Pkinase-domain-containing protein [Meredithblackwellia eburnea MCA 4105]
MSSSSNPSSPLHQSTFSRHESASYNGNGIALALGGQGVKHRPPDLLLPHSHGHQPPPRSQTPASPRPIPSPVGPAPPAPHLDVKSWSDDQVSDWLTEVNCAQYSDTFRKNDIRGNVLLDVDQMALKEMGIRSVGDRVKITVAIKALRQRSSATSLHPNHPSHHHHHLHHQQSSLGGVGAHLGESAFSNSSSRSASSSRLASSSSYGNLPHPTNLNAQRLISSPYSSSIPGVAPSISTTAASPTTAFSANHPPSASWGEYGGLPRAPGPGNLGGTVNGPPYPRTASSSPASNERKLSSSSLNNVASSSSSITPTPTPPGTAASNRPPVGVLPPRPSTGTTPSSSLNQQSSSYQHRKQSSSGRPSTSQATYGLGSNGPSTHPYAATASSPTADAFSVTSYGRNPPGAGLKTLLPSPAIGIGAGGNKGALSPVSEPSDGSRSAGSVSSQGGQLQQQQGYSVGRGGFARPTTPGGIVSANGPVPGSTQWGNSHASEGLDAVLRKTIKLLGDDGVSKTVAVADCKDGEEVLARVLKKFQKPGYLGLSTPGGTTNGGVAEPGAEDEQWGVFTTGQDGQYKLLSPAELFIVCRDGQAPERHGLTVRRIPKPTKRGRKLQWMFGEPSTPDSTRPGGAVASPSPTSPNYLGVEIPSTTVEPASPSSSSSSSERGLAALQAASSPSSASATERTKMNRASTISVMSGLGADWPTTPPRGSSSAASSNDHSAGDPSQNPSIRSPSSGSFLSPGRKLRNFFGQRPPSELIATHLTEYFPRAEKRLMSKTVRQSMRKSMVRRDSHFSVVSAAPSSWSSPNGAQAGAGGAGSADRLGEGDTLSPGSLSRFSGSSHGSAKSTPLPLPPMEDPGSPPRIGGGRSSNDSTRTPSILEPPDESAEDDDTRSIASSALAHRRLSRLSTNSRLSTVGWDRRSRDKDSDTASMLTVDEVTAELETRRMSMASFESEEDEEPPEGRYLRPPSIAVDSEDGDLEEESDEDYDTEEEEEEEGGEQAGNGGEAAKPALKWIKGALIGSGSFGSVFLGMNPMSGSLMAVKQVELPTGNSHNEERKKSMLDALEREIELLKDLQHENIVQYLDSSSDATHLNIFLEYVPGGSVAALLSNYGAFEEALVSKFVRQILTGLDYLHEREIIHRDIKGANILVDNKGGIKISDFGISKRVEDNLLTGAKVHRPSLQGSVYWMAPEVVKQTAYTSKADIWSLGCLVVEMLTGAHPWANLTQMQAIFRIGSSSRPSIPDDISTEAEEFLEDTFEIDHNDRPSARDLLAHAFIRDPESFERSQQTPTRATFSQQAAAAKDSTS